MGFFGFGGGRPEQSMGRAEPARAAAESAESSGESLSPVEVNRQMMIDAIAEHMWNIGLAKEMVGTLETRKAATRSMAIDALGRVPRKFESLPVGELRENKSFLVAEAVRLYQENGNDQEGGDLEDQASAK